MNWPSSSLDRIRQLHAHYAQLTFAPLTSTPTPMEQELSVLEKLQMAYELVADALGHAPQLHDTHLDQALLLLVLAMKRARRSKRLRPPPLQWRLDDHDVPF